LVRFIEWAYRNDYPNTVPLSKFLDIGKVEQPFEIAKKDNVESSL